MRTATATVPGVEGRARPRFVLPNGGGLGYGLFVLDDVSRAYLVDHIEQLPDPLTRGSAWVTLWDNLLEGAIPPPALFDSALRALPPESDEQNVQRILGYAGRIYWRFLSPEQRQARGVRFETVLRDGLSRASTQSQKSAWFSAYRDTVLSAEGLAWLERVWRREERVPGLTLAEPDEITLAMELAVREVPRWKEILEAQLARTQNPDRRDRLAFVMPALSADPAERERSFERFRLLENRRREVWVQDSLQYLNHPLRAAHGQRFVQPALEMRGRSSAPGTSSSRRAGWSGRCGAIDRPRWPRPCAGSSRGRRSIPSACGGRSSAPPTNCSERPASQPSQQRANGCLSTEPFAHRLIVEGGHSLDHQCARRPVGVTLGLGVPVECGDAFFSLFVTRRRSRRDQEAQLPRLAPE
jgi:hypothetical protein